MKKLLIVESPAKIKTIGKFLGKDFTIMSTVGHIKDLPAKKIGVEVKDDEIIIDYVVMDKKAKVIADICKVASNSDEVYLAPDPDREGEIIAWHIGEEIKKVIKKGGSIKRITFNEITKPAILEAIEHPSNVDMQKVHAQQARRILDRWVGYEVSPVLWKKIAKGLSAGRVQSVALRLICDRENAIKNFKPEESWSIEGLFAKDAKNKVTAILSHIGKKKAELKNKEEADAVVKDLKKVNYTIDSITDKERKKSANAPFMTSTLQQAAYNSLGFSVKKTMQVAQNLYEGVPLDNPQSPVALITYMRTDSLRISDSALAQSRDYISKQFGKEYLPTKANIYAAKEKGQDAHEAVRPIDVNITPDYVKKFVGRDQAKLYELIWKRFVACQMTPAIYAQRQLVIIGGNYTFKVTGSTLIFDGFLKVYKADDDTDEQTIVIPIGLKAKDAVDLEKIDPKQHFTQPPPRYTEASLVKEMKEEGIGRPSTYSAILDTIRGRSYTELDAKKRFVPTELGMTVVKMLTENLPHIMDIKFTALMEEDLDKIAAGTLERDKLLHEFYDQFSKDLDSFRGKDIKKMTEETTIDCPECGKAKLVIRFGKSGHFIGCPNYPECKFTSNFKRLEDGSIELTKTQEPELLAEKCPKCGKQLRQVVGKFGPFTACSGYPECKYIHQDIAKFACPSDGGQLSKKNWRGSIFWGCSNYPKCKFTISGDIEETPCPKCKNPYLLKRVNRDTGDVSLACANKDCGYTA